MTDTQKRIKAYKDALPGIKERLAAVALLLVISIAMVTSATFAWLTISRNPEVSGVNMSVAANGNLEVALVAPDGSLPGKSAVGDSSATKGQTIAGANITWGNLVNLSDPSYGLEHLVLRPAQINTADLLSSPLYGAVYNQDGRIVRLNSSFGYTVWTEATEEMRAHFAVSDKYGVRAISSITISAEGDAAIYQNMYEDAKNKNIAAGNRYATLANNKGYMNSLSTIMGLYMTARMNSTHATLSNPTCSMEDLENLRDMYAEFIDAYEMEAQAIAAAVNLQLFIANGKGNYAPFAAEEFYPQGTLATADLTAFISNIKSKMSRNNVAITRLEEFIEDYNTINSDYQKMVDLCNTGGDLKWSDSGLNQIANNLVNVGNCTIDGTPISSIGASNAMGYLSGEHTALITNGILYHFEERTGSYLFVDNMKITATISRGSFTVPGTVTADVLTSAPRDYNLFKTDLDTYAARPDSFVGGTAVANDTYGLAVDLWVRTNAVGSFLTLEGNVLSTSREVTATGKDPDGNEVVLYTITISDEDEASGETITYELDLYQKETTDEQGNAVTKWYNADTHTEMTLEDGVTPKEKKEILTTVTGYEGENRVWEDNVLLSVDATTQGSGSCYVYYADTPEDQARSLKLLEAFNVAFVDAEGKLLATAVMDTENYFAANGRVVVPLILSISDSINLGTDDSGVNHYAITALEQNVPTRITAIVYLDGTKLTNQEVLAASDIQGQLNIQFGSNQSLEAISNEDLENAIRKVEATVACSSGNNQTSGFTGSEANYDVVFNYDTVTSPMTVDVTVTVTGDKPNKVEAFFLRSISASQGSREKEEQFTPQPDGTWKATFTFDDPGSYILRTIRLDGVDYNLADMPTVLVKGFTVKNLMCSNVTAGRHIAIMTADNSRSVDLTLEFAADDIRKMPQTVQGRFLREDGTAANAQFTYDTVTGKWKGKATFLSSGDYTLQYLILNGQYVELPESLWLTATVTLGMRVEIYTTSPHTFKFIPAEMDPNQKELDMQVKIVDNEGNEMGGLSDVSLTYVVRGANAFMDTDLAWNGTYYVGKLDALTAGPGVWVFSNVQVGSDNTLTTASRYPTFTIQPANPPEYDNHGTVTYFYAPNKDAAMTVDLAYTQTASVAAYVVKDGAAEGKWITGTRGVTVESADGKPVSTWSFVLPGDANGYQDGHWQLTQVKIWDAYAEDGTQYTETEPLLLEVPGYSAKIVNRVYVTFAQGQSQDFGKDASGKITGAFLQSYTISGLTVDIKDFENLSLQESAVSEISILLTQNGDSRSYGGYTSDSVNGAAYTIKFKKDPSDANGTRYIQDGTVTLQYAGSYTSTLTVKSGVNSISVYQIANLPQYTVSSVTPSVVITGVTPSTSISTGITYKTDSMPGWLGGGTIPTFTATTPKTNSFTSYYAEVYAKMKADNNGAQRHGTVETIPQVKLKVTGLGNADSATVIILAGDADSAVSHQFTTDNQEIWYQLGTAKQFKSWTSNWGALKHTLQAYYGHGTQTISEITLTKGSMTFTVYLENDVVIKNPSSVNPA